METVKDKAAVIKAKPFVKWLGGKSKILQSIIEEFPEKCSHYYEPLVGGGAIFLNLANKSFFKKATIGDSNPELINAWTVIKNDVDALIKELKNKKFLYDKKVYLEIRSISESDLDDVQRAARFIYLNHTCFNGLYRVNLKGQFNTPFGKYKDPKICDVQNLQALNKLLKNVEIVSTDFEKTVEMAKKNDLVYFDPPYIPISNTSNFSSYTAKKFLESDHWRLAGLFDKLSKRKVNVVASNSSSDLSRKLYAGYKIKEITGSRTVAGPSLWRNSVKELIISNNKLV